MGRKTGNGTWAEYYVNEATSCIPLGKDVTKEQGAALLVNPLTVIGLLDMAKSLGAKAAVQNAAMSQVGQMLVRLFESESIPLISVVRRPEQEARLRALGAPYVLNSESPDFLQRLRALANDLRATVAFDAVAGPATGVLLNNLPAKSTVVVYGVLSDRSSEEIDPIEIIFALKNVSGFYLGEWLKRRGFLGTLRSVSRAKNLMQAGILTTEVAFRFGIDEVRQGLKNYMGQYSKGKALLLLD